MYSADHHSHHGGISAGSGFRDESQRTEGVNPFLSSSAPSASPPQRRVILPHRVRRRNVAEESISSGVSDGHKGGGGGGDGSTVSSALRGDVALTDLTTIASRARNLADKALLAANSSSSSGANPPLSTTAHQTDEVLGGESSTGTSHPRGTMLGSMQQNNNTNWNQPVVSSPTTSSHHAAGGAVPLPRRAYSSLSLGQHSSSPSSVVAENVAGSRGMGLKTDPPTFPLPPPNARVSSAAAVFRSRVSEGARLGGGDLAPTSKLVSRGVAERFSSGTTWHNQQRYHPVDVTLSPLLQERQLAELKEAMFAPPKSQLRKRGLSSASGSGANEESGGGAFLTSTALEGGGGQTSSATMNGTAAVSDGVPRKKKGAPQSTTSHLNNKIGLRRMPNSDIALNEVFTAHSVSLQPPDAPLFGGALTTEGGKKGGKGGRAGSVVGGGGGDPSVVLVTTKNLDSTLDLDGKRKKKGETVAPLISNISAIHRGLAPHVDLSSGQIALLSLQRYLSSLVPPEYESSAISEYIRPFLKQCYDEYTRLQMTSGGSAIAGTAGAEAEDLLNQTSVSATTETQSNAGDTVVMNDAASTVGARSARAPSRVGTVRAPSVVAGSEAGGSRAVSPASHGFARHTSPSQASLGPVSRVGGGGTTVNSVAAAANQKLQRERQEEEFFSTARLPYTHVLSCFEHLLKPNAVQPVSNMVADSVSGATLSARVCFLLCDPLKRGYITRDSVKAMRNDQATTEDYSFNVVQGLTRAMQIVEKLEEERFAVVARKGKKGKASSKKPVPLPTVRQFHMSLDEFTHILCTDAYVVLAFLPYIIKTSINGHRAEVAQQPVPFYGKSQVAYPALQRANYREKKAAEANLSHPIKLDAMSADDIESSLQPRKYPPIVSSLAQADVNSDRTAVPLPARGALGAAGPLGSLSLTIEEQTTTPPNDTQQHASPI